MAEVVGADLALEAVDGLRVRHGHDAGVVDQHVDAVDAVGEFAHRRQVLQVELAHLDVAGHARGGGVALRGVAHGEDHLGADAGQLAGGDLAEAAVGAGDDDGAPGEGGQVGGGPVAHGASLVGAAGITSRATVKPLMIASMSGPFACGLVGEAVTVNWMQVVLAG